jgi:hypothetical protein
LITESGQSPGAVELFVADGLGLEDGLGECDGDGVDALGDAVDALGEAPGDCEVPVAEGFPPEPRPRSSQPTKRTTRTITTATIRRSQ